MLAPIIDSYVSHILTTILLPPALHEKEIIHAQLASMEFKPPYSLCSVSLLFFI